MIDYHCYHFSLIAIGENFGKSYPQEDVPDCDSSLGILGFLLGEKKHLGLMALSAVFFLEAFTDSK